MRYLAWVVIVAACGSKSDSPEPAAKVATDKTAPAAGKPADTPAPAAAPAKPKTAKPPPTKEQRADYKKHMKAGWAHQKAKKWAEAVPEFEAAGKAIDGDPRALTELGWSAQNAGDFVTARKADEQAIGAAVDKNVKAAGLYNLGTVQEKTGDKDGALKSYIASLKLRPNKTVEQAVGRLGASPTAEAPCTNACDCIAMDAYATNNPTDYEHQCTKDAYPTVKGFNIYHLAGWQSFDYLLDEHDQIVTAVGGGMDRAHHDESITIDKAEVKTIGGHRVLWLITVDQSHTHYPAEDADEETDTHTKAVTICVIGDAKTPTKCPLRDVPLAVTTDRATVPWDEKTPGKTSSSETAVDVALASDGTVTVKLVKGASDHQIESFVGPHKLW